MSVTLCGVETSHPRCAPRQVKEKASLCGFDWFRIQPSLCLQLWPDVLGGGRTGFVGLPLPASEISVPFLQVPSA